MLIPNYVQVYNPKNLHVFRKLYPKGENFVVGYDVDKSYQKQYDDLIVTFVSIQELIQKLLP